MTKENSIACREVLQLCDPFLRRKHLSAWLRLSQKGYRTFKRDIVRNRDKVAL